VAIRVLQAPVVLVLELVRRSRGNGIASPPERVDERFSLVDGLERQEGVSLPVRYDVADLVLEPAARVRRKPGEPLALPEGGPAKPVLSPPRWRFPPPSHSSGLRLGEEHLLVARIRRRLRQKPL
jgi:hypothetical protein